MIGVILVTDVALDDEAGHLVSDRPDKVAARPEFPAPELVPDPRKFLEDLFGGDALQGFHDMGRGEAGRSRDEEMDMIRLDILFNDLESIGRSYLGEEVFKKFLHFGRANVLAILGCPDEMVVQLIDSMGGSAIGHTLRSYHGDAAFIRTARAVRYSAGL